MEEEEESSLLSRAERSVFGPLAYNIAVLAMNGGYLIAFLAAAYLIYGLVSGHLADFNTLPSQSKQIVLSNIHLAGQALTFGLGIGSLAMAYVLWGEDFVGYAIFVVALLVGIGVPQGFQMLGGDKNAGQATNSALAAFANAMMPPLAIGGILVARDIVLRLIGAVQNRPVRVEKMTYGKGAAQETRPRRTSLLGKCWEGPYCREFIREHCPIFVARKACWRERRGCYCEEEIVSTAAAKVSGIHLEMAPDPKLNFANPATPGLASGGLSSISGTPQQPASPVAFDPLNSGPVQMMTIGGERVDSGGGFGGGLSMSPTPPRKIELSAGQKRERCRNCVIYNEHQREKYQVLMPVTLIGSLAICVLISQNLRNLIGAALHAVDNVLNRASFLPGSENAVHLAQPSEVVEWLLFAALTLMIISKMLQALEWAVFKIKI